MRFWLLLFAVTLFMTSCSQEKQPQEKIYFSVLVPKPERGQSTQYVQGIQVFTSKAPRSVVSAMVVNNPIRADREALIALAIENRTDHTMPLKWEEISFFHPKNIIKLLPIDEICDYFQQPGHSKPILGSKVFKEDLLKYGVVSDETGTKRLLPTEQSLDNVYTGIQKDLCYVKLPHNTTLPPKSTTVGFLVILLPKENFTQQTNFMLTIPIGEDAHKLRYTLQPID